MRVITFFILLLSTVACVNSDQNSVTLVSSEEMKELMLMNSVQLVDVRTVEEFRDSHLKGAQNLVFDSDFAQKIKTLDKSKPVAVYCRTGNRSEKCSKILKEAGFEQIYDLEGGLSEWKFQDELVKDSLPQ